jgi:hypothetical protein
MSAQARQRGNNGPRPRAQQYTCPRLTVQQSSAEAGQRGNNGPRSTA